MTNGAAGRGGGGGKKRKTEDETLDQVKNYYGKVLKKSDDLQTNACTTEGEPPEYIKAAIKRIHPDVISKYYGCGIVVPDLCEGLSVLDLGCGAGRDCYILSQLVGENGHVTGVDMTDEQLAIARQYEDHHAQAFGYKRKNTQFVQGFMEKLDELGLADNSFDLIVSNCVINLSPDKEAVLREAYRVLKPGGELYFSDVYASRRVPKELVSDPVLYGECISGALYWNDFLHLARKCGFMDPRLCGDKPITVCNPTIEDLVGHIDFYSATYRLFKLDDLEPDCEDYGQAVIYKGTIPTCPVAFTLDSHHRIEKGKVFPVCGNTNMMLADTRFKEHFTYIGDTSNHYGIFDGCGKSIPFTADQSSSSAGGGCC